MNEGKHKPYRGRCLVCRTKYPCPHLRSQPDWVEAPIVDGGYLPPEYLLGVASNEECHTPIGE